MYLYDFLNSILSFDKYNYGVEFLEIWLPIHFILDKLAQMCQKLATIIDTHDYGNISVNNNINANVYAKETCNEITRLRNLFVIATTAKRKHVC